jgi:hypothetical protein
MALIAVIDGVKLYMYPNDHPPVHFHALFAKHHAVFDIETLALTRGQLPRPKARAIAAWAAPRREQLVEAWILVQSHLFVGRVE